MMKRGAKRPALSDSDPNFNSTVSTLRSKSVMDAPSFDVHRAESSRQHLMAGVLPLDVKRAESSRQHVRALNTQFASWVQLQLQNHPDELWEDGVKDYLSHASHIMEKFKDVVDWLRANAAKLGSATTVGSPSDQDNSVDVSKNAKPSLNSESSNGFVLESKSSSLQSAGLSISQSSALFSLSQTPTSSSGFQNLALSSSLSSGLFSTSQTASSSSLLGLDLSSSQSLGFFGISQTPASSSLQSSGLSSSQSSGLFGFGQTSASSSFQSLGSSTLQSSGLFGFGQTPASSSFQSSGSSCSPSSGFFGIGQSPASSSLQSLGSSSLQSSGFFCIGHTPASSSLQSSGLSSSQSLGFFAAGQTPVFRGIQSFTPPKVEASGEDEDELEQPTSPSLKKTEEKGVIVVHEVKCKVYIKPDNPADKSWKDMGMGQLSIKCKEGASKASKESKPTIVIRNDVGKILLNALIYPGIKMNIKKNTIASIFHTSVGGHNNGIEAAKGDVVARTYLLRLKSEEETTKLEAAIKDYAPSA